MIYQLYLIKLKLQPIIFNFYLDTDILIAWVNLKTSNLDDKYLINLGIKLKNRLDKLPVSVEFFAHSIGMTRQALHQIIHGRSEMRLFTLVKICRELEISISDLLSE